MSKKTEADQNAQLDREARLQGEKTALDQAGGRGDQTTVAEQGGQRAVDASRQQREQAKNDPVRYDSHNNPIDQQAEDKAAVQRRDHDAPGPDATRERR
jgi:hypothetical protein